MHYSVVISWFTTYCSLGVFATVVALYPQWSFAQNDIAPVRLVTTIDAPRPASPARFDVGITSESDVGNGSGTAIEASFRATEAILIGARMRREFQRSDDWGVVRLFPEGSVIPQLALSITVLASDGQQLELRVAARHVAGKLLLDRRYRDIASDEDYLGDRSDPFDDLYATVYRDVVRELSAHSPSESYLRTVSMLRYARGLLPSAFSGYLEQVSGQWQVKRVPSDLDPMILRLKRLQDYELLFVDTIDEQLTKLHDEVGAAYLQWLKASKTQLDWLEKRRERQVNTNEFTDESTFTSLQAVYAAYRSLKIHEQELFELVIDLEGETRSTQLYANERIFELTGTVEQQYREWRDTLRRIDALESDL